MKIDFRSSIVGALFGALAVLALGAQTFSVTPLNQPVIVSGIPMPQQMMRVVEGQQFVVPQGKVFVATGLGSNDAAYQGGGTVTAVTVRFDGVSVLAGEVHSFDATHSGQRTLPAIPPGLSAPAGTIVTVDIDADEQGTLGVLLGYLADAAQ